MMFLGEEITVARVRAAYASMGMVPADGLWLNGKECCPLAVLLLEAGKREIVEKAQNCAENADNDHSFYIAEAGDAKEEEVLNFTKGFDALKGDSPCYKLGELIRREVLNAPRG